MKHTGSSPNNAIQKHHKKRSQEVERKLVAKTVEEIEEGERRDEQGRGREEEEKGQESAADYVISR